MKQLPAVIEAVVKPKPTKRETIEAMARVHIENLRKHNQQFQSERQRLHKAIEKQMRCDLRKNLSRMEAHARCGYEYGESNYSGVELEVQFKPDVRSEKLNALLREYHALKQESVPSPNEAKRRISSQMAGLTPTDTRVDMIVSDVESRKAINEMLKVLKL